MKIVALQPLEHCHEKKIGGGDKARLIKTSFKIIVDIVVHSLNSKLAWWHDGMSSALGSEGPWFKQ